MSDIITLHIRDLTGKDHIIQAPTDMGLNLMEAIKSNGLPIKAMCGGMAMCASCNVQILSNHTLPKMAEAEEAMLDEAMVLEVKGSRLSCQIPITEVLDGIHVVLGELTNTTQ